MATRLRLPASNLLKLGELVSDRLVRFPGASWQEIEALPQPMRWTVQRTIFHLLDEPVPGLADPFPADDPLPGAYELNLTSDNETIWCNGVHELGKLTALCTGDSAGSKNLPDHAPGIRLFA